MYRDLLTDLKETPGSKHIIFYFINIYPTELKLTAFKCPPNAKRKAGNVFINFRGDFLT